VVGFFPPVGIGLVDRTSSWNSIVESVSPPSRTRRAARYSFVRITKRPSATRSVRAITSTRSRYAFTVPSLSPAGATR
jgi:hypothetical protein